MPAAQTIEHYNKNPFGLVCVDPENFKGARTKVMWRCPKGHETSKIPSDTLYYGCWVCRNYEISLRSKTPYELILGQAKERGIQLLTSQEEYNSKIDCKLSLRCSMKHEWSAGWKTLQKRWCIKCNYNNRLLPDLKGRLRAATYKHKMKIRDFVNEFKNFPCKDCGKIFPSYCMEFDHLRDKVMPVSEMIARHLKRETIALEIAKCDLVCALCHRDRTFIRRENLPKSQLKQQQRRREGLIFISSLKANKPCTDCGEIYKTHQMDFDHLPGVKKNNHLSKMTNLAKSTILKEVAKCELVCVICHKHRTHNRHNNLSIIPEKD